MPSHWVLRVWFILVHWLDLPQLTNIHTILSSIHPETLVLSRMITNSDWFYLPQLVSLETEDASFNNTRVLHLEGICLLELANVDLPNLTKFVTGNHSFLSVTSLNLTSMISVLWICWSSSVNNIYSRCRLIHANEWFEFDSYDWLNLPHSISLNWQTSQQERIRSDIQNPWILIVSLLISSLQWPS